MNAESQYTITGQHGQSLNINPQKPDPNLASIIEYAGKTGNKLQVVYCDKSRYTYDAEHVGISSLEATKQIEGWIKNWVREMLEGQRQTLTEQYDKSEFHSHLTNFLNGLEEGTDSQAFGKWTKHGQRENERQAGVTVTRLHRQNTLFLFPLQPLPVSTASKREKQQPNKENI